MMDKIDDEVMAAVRRFQRTVELPDKQARGLRRARGMIEKIVADELPICVVCQTRVTGAELQESVDSEQKEWRVTLVTQCHGKTWQVPAFTERMARVLAVDADTLARDVYAATETMLVLPQFMPRNVGIFWCCVCRKAIEGSVTVVRDVSEKPLVFSNLFGAPVERALPTGTRAEVRCHGSTEVHPLAADEKKAQRVGVPGSRGVELLMDPAFSGACFIEEALAVRRRRAAERLEAERKAQRAASSIPLPEAERALIDDFLDARDLRPSRSAEKRRKREQERLEQERREQVRLMTRPVRRLRLID